MFDKKKNLFANGVIKNTSSIQNVVITDITGKLKRIKGMRVQFDALGYIVDGVNIVETRKPITSLINQQINRLINDHQRGSSYTNARSLIASFIKDPKRVHRHTHMATHFLIAMEEVEKKTNDSKQAHTVVIRRLWKQDKARALFKEMEIYRDNLKMD